MVGECTELPLQRISAQFGVEKIAFDGIVDLPQIESLQKDLL